jgi:hypothetical protein
MLFVIACVGLKQEWMRLHLATASQAPSPPVLALTDRVPVPSSTFRV